MIKLLVSTLVLAAILSAPAKATPAPPISLVKSQPWNINYGEDSCQLVGVFGKGDDQAYVRFTRFGLGDGFKLALFGKRLRRSEPFSEMMIDFGPVANPRRMLVVAGMVAALPMLEFGSQRLDDGPYDANNQDRPKIRPEFEASVTWLTAGPVNGKTYRFELGSMKAPMAALRKCTDDLIQHWGYDPTEQGTLSKHATPSENPGHWMSSWDFPPGLKGQNGLVEFRLDVDPIGNTTGCHILSATKPEEFGKTACGVLARRAKFKPALDAKGAPVRSFYVGRVTFRSPG